MEWIAVAVIGLAFGAVTGWIARRKERSFAWWGLAGFFAPLPTLALVAVVPRGGEPFHFSAPKALLIFAAIVVTPFVLLAVAAELFV